MPGFKLVRGRSIRKWSSEEEALALVQTLPIDEKDLYSKPHLLSPAQMEELLKSKKLDRRILESVIIKPEGELTLAPIEDGRPEVKPLGIATKEFAAFK